MCQARFFSIESQPKKVVVVVVIVVVVVVVVILVVVVVVVSVVVVVVIIESLVKIWSVIAEIYLLMIPFCLKITDWYPSFPFSVKF